MDNAINELDLMDIYRTLKGGIVFTAYLKHLRELSTCFAISQVSRSFKESVSHRLHTTITKELSKKSRAKR